MSTDTEARFFEPTALCPRPELWHSVDGDSAEVEVSDLLFGLVRALQPELCVETGAAFGQSAYAIGDALRMNGHGHLISLELDPIRAQIAAETCRDLPVSILRAPSLEWEPLADTRIGFVFLDSVSTLRVAEFRHLRSWMHAGSIVCMHDTAPGHGKMNGSDTREQIERELVSEVRLIHLPTPRGLTIAEVV